MERLNSWIDKGMGLVALLDAEGIELVRDNGEFFCNNANRALELSAAFDPLAYELPLAVDRVNAHAYDIIVGIMPPYKQNNAMALGLQNTMHYGADPANWPPDQQATLQAVNLLWARIQAVRAYSDQINAGLAAETDWQKLRDFDPKADPSWPK
jgi:hypothetical protein